MTRKNFGRNDLFLILGIFAAAVLMLAAYSRYMSHADTPMLEITVDNQLFGTYDLKHDALIRIKDTNVCEIKDGTVRMLSASCPDQICVRSLPITEKGGSIVCLPNRVVLKIVHTRDSRDPAGKESDSGSTPATSGSSGPQIDSLAE